MEEDRAQVDVGVAVEAELAVDGHEHSRQPNRRFVGRKTAAARIAPHTEGFESIENNGAIQGMPESIARWVSYAEAC